ncbi:MAG: hypothetical protein NVSMB65_14360 [Chloroflexota bacterium]
MLIPLQSVTETQAIPTQTGVPSGDEVVLLIGGARLLYRGGGLAALVDLTPEQSAFLTQYPLIAQALSIVTTRLVSLGTQSVQGRLASGRLCLGIARCLWGLVRTQMASLSATTLSLVLQAITIARNTGVLCRGQSYTATGTESVTWNAAAQAALLVIEAYDPAFPGTASPLWSTLLAALVQGTAAAPTLQRAPAL